MSRFGARFLPAFDQFREREPLCTKQKISGQYLFGFRCRAVQEHLFALRDIVAAPPVQRVEKTVRGGMKKILLKLVIQQAKKENLLHIAELKEEGNKARLFQYRACQATVENMLSEMQKPLIEGRDPLERARQILVQLLNHPDIKPLLRSIVGQTLACEPKELAVICHIIENIKLAISVHKQQRNTNSIRLYQSLMAICVPPPEKRLQRATVRLLGINSRRGLIAGAMRVAAQRVDAEAGVQADGDEDSDSEADAASGTPANLFMYSQRKQRSDFEAGAEIRAKAREWWDTRTRVSSCRRNVVKLADGKSHPVHWLEQTVDSFRQSFLDEGDHYYNHQLLRIRPLH